MNQLTQTKIRFSDAANSIGVKPKALRNWLQRNQITLFSDHTGAKWTEFTLGDIAVLAVMRRLTDWGLTVNQANQIAYKLMDKKIGLLLLFKSTPVNAALASLRLYRLILVHDEETGETCAALLTDRDDLPVDGTDFVFVNIGLVVEVAFSRLESD